MWQTLTVIMGAADAPAGRTGGAGRGAGRGEGGGLGGFAVDLVLGGLGPGAED
jgi:hypothetical protein